MSNDNNKNKNRPTLSTNGKSNRTRTQSGVPADFSPKDAPHPPRRRSFSTTGTVGSDLKRSKDAPDPQRRRTAPAIDDIRRRERRTPRPDNTENAHTRPPGGGNGRGGGTRKDKLIKNYSKMSLPKKILMAFMTIVTFGFVSVTVYSAIVLKDIPQIDATTLNKALEQQSIILDSHGKVVEIVKDNIDRKIIKYNNISKKTIDTIVAVEDKTFWEHEGFNFVRLAGSIVDSITRQESVKGTSTITQQLARNLYLSKVKTLDRKIKEAYYANKIEKQIDKKDIITGYLNTIYLGAGAYGVESASNRYFSKPAKKLDWVESAMIAGIPSSPTAYAPVTFLKKENLKKSMYVIDDTPSQYVVVYNPKCEKRYAVVLGVLRDQGKITPAQYEKYKAVNLKKKIKFSSDKPSEISSYFTDMVKDDVIKGLVEKYDLSVEEANNYLYTKGLTIHSTLDLRMQKTLESQYKIAKNNGIVPRPIIRYGSGSNIVSSEGVILLYNYNNLVNSKGQFYLASGDYTFASNGNLTVKKRGKLYFYPVYSGKKLINIKPVIKSSYKPSDNSLKMYEGYEIDIPAKYKSFDSDNNLVISKAYLSENPKMFKKSSNGILTVPKNNFIISKVGVTEPQSSMVILDPYKGELKALVGGVGIKGQKLFNRAMSPRQPGSSIKPMSAYLTAIESKRYTPNSGMVDEPVFFGPNGSRWPLNWTETFNTGTKYRGWMTLRSALDDSNNVIAAKLVKELGTQTCMATLKKLGVSTIDDVNDDNLAAMALGGMTKGVSPLEMTRAYSVFLNGGKLMTIHTFTVVKDLDGKVILENKPDGKQIVSEQDAYTLTSMLKSVVDNGLGKDAKTWLPTAGKTGTTSNNMDAWFVGFTPYYVAATWFGNDVNIELDSGSSQAAIFWRIVMNSITQGKPYKEFSVPEGQAPLVAEERPETAKICTVSNMIASYNCPQESVLTVEINDDNRQKYNFSKKCDVHVKKEVPVEQPENGSNNGSNTQNNIRNNASIVDAGGGGYKVVKSFRLQLNNGKSITVSPGSRINGDFSFTLTNGRTIQANEVSSYPDINSLLGN